MSIVKEEARFYQREVISMLLDDIEFCEQALKDMDARTVEYKRLKKGIEHMQRAMRYIRYKDYEGRNTYKFIELDDKMKEHDCLLEEELYEVMGKEQIDDINDASVHHDDIDDELVDESSDESDNRITIDADVLMDLVEKRERMENEMYDLNDI